MKSNPIRAYPSRDRKGAVACIRAATVMERVKRQWFVNSDSWLVKAISQNL